MAHAHQHARSKGSAVIGILADGQRLTLSTKDDLLVCHHATGANRVNRNTVDGGTAGTMAALTAAENGAQVLLLVALGTGTPVLAWTRWAAIERALRHRRPLPSSALGPVVAVGAAVAGLLVLIGLAAA